MRVLVFEPKYVGHFLGFATYAANAFARRGHDVTMVVPQQASGSEQAEIKLGQRLKGVDVAFALDLPLLYQKWENAKFETRALEACISDFACDHLVVPSADFLLCGLLQNRKLRHRLRSMTRADLILHNCAQTYPGLGKRERWRLVWDQWAVEACRHLNLFCVDPFAMSRQAKRPTGLFRQPVQALPHPFDPITNRPSKAAARAALGMPTDRWIIGSIGDLGVRKGTELLIHSFALYAKQHPGDLALYGLLSESAHQALDQYAGLRDRMHIRNAFVTEAEFIQFLSAMDVVWAGYPRHIGIASVLLHAADADRLALAGEFGCVGWMTREYGLGLCVSNDPKQISSIMVRCRDDPHAFPGSRRQALLAYHNTRHFEEVLAGLSVGCASRVKA